MTWNGRNPRRPGRARAPRSRAGREAGGLGTVTKTVESFGGFAKQYEQSECDDRTGDRTRGLGRVRAAVRPGGAPVRPSGVVHRGGRAVPHRRGPGAKPPVLPFTAIDDPALPEVLAELAAARADEMDADTASRELSIARKAIGWWQRQGWIVGDPTVGIERRPAPPICCPASSPAVPAARCSSPTARPRPERRH